MTPDAHKPALPALFVRPWRIRLARRVSDAAEPFMPEDLRRCRLRSSGSTLPYSQAEGCCSLATESNRGPDLG